MAARPISRVSNASILWLIVAATLVHGLLLLNDGVYWDVHVVYRLLADANWSELRRMFTEMGAPATPYLFWIARLGPDIVFTAKATMFACAVVSALAVRASALESGLVGEFEATSVALISMSFPAYRVGVELMLMPSTLCYTAFLVAAFLTLRSDRAAGLRRALLRVAGLALFLVSFLLPSLLSLFFGVYLLRVCVRRTAGTPWTRALVSGPYDVVLLLTPFASFATQRMAFSRSGLGEGYNTILLSIGQLLTESGWFLRRALYDSVNAALRGVLDQPVLAIAVLLAALAIARRWHADGAPRERLASMCAFGAVLLALAIGPYAVVGKSPTADVWTTRHAALVGVPAGILIVSAAALALRQPGGAPSVAERTIVLACAAAFGVSVIANYLAWQAAWVKDRSIVEQLRRAPGARAYSVFFVNDRFPTTVARQYRSYDWASLFERAWGDQRHVAVRAGSTLDAWLAAERPLLIPRYGMGEADPYGCQAELVVSPGRLAGDDLTVAADYTYYRLFRPSRVPDFLAKISAVEISPHPSTAATSCRAGVQ